VPRWLAPTAVGAVLLVAAASLGWWSARGPEVAPVAAPVTSPPPPSPTAEPTPPPAAQAQDWAALLDGLDARRAEAFATADAALLDDVYAPDAPGLAADRALVEQLVAAGQTASGVRHEVRGVEELEAGPDRARLRVVDVLGAYELRDGGGAVVAATPARGESAYLVELARTDAGWRLAGVTPA
jgi:eukaryotic-like serine/threonine-protein kinase